MAVAFSITQLPEPGQLVKVRGRAWVVSDIRASAVTADPLTGKAAPPSHLITLSSIEDDAMGEELRVIWEVEPGTAILEKGGLPLVEDFDDPKKLEAFLHAVQWGASSTADYRVLLSPYRSGIQIEDYQLDPLVRAVQMPRANILIADDVGLGKTIEAGLIVQEFITRHRARSVLIVCPSSLQIKWQQEMRDKFGAEFRIVDHQLFQDLRRKRGIHVNPWTHFPRLITSIDFIKTERRLDLMLAVLPPDGQPTYPRKFDILIVDEAHHVAPSGGLNYATDSQRTEVIRKISPHFENRIFITATPHNGYWESFTSLLELVDRQRFARGVKPDEKQLRAIMVRRLKSDIDVAWDGTARFPVRHIDILPVNFSEDERQAHADLQEYAALRRTSAKSAEETFAAEFIMKLLKKRLFSSPTAFYNTLTKHIGTLMADKKDPDTIKKPAMSILKKQSDALDEDFADENQEQEVLTESLTAIGAALPNLSQAEHALLDRMMKWAATHRARPDSKAAELIIWLNKNIRPNGKWTNRRVVIFTEYRDTQKWLLEIFAAQGFTQGNRVETIYGGMDDEKREEVKAAFQAAPEDSPVRILLATDAASEGIDLQMHCSDLIHFEIPWNPNRMEQRNGRIDRYGQKAPQVNVYHFVDKNFKNDASAWSSNPGDLAGDLEFLYRAVMKLRQMDRDLFGKVSPVVARQVEEAMLGRRKSLDTKRAEENADEVRRSLRFQEDIKRQIQRLHEKLKETQVTLEISPENIRDVVTIALELAGQPPLQNANDQKFPSGTVFRMPYLRGSWAKCAQGLSHPHTGAVRPITFDHAIAKDRDDVVLVHLNHPLVQMSLHLLRAEVWSDSGSRKLNRATVRVVPDALLENPAILLYGRAVLVGKDGGRLHEEIITAGGVLVADRFRRFQTVGEVGKLIQASEAREVPDDLQQKLIAAWKRHQDSAHAALQARLKEKADGLQRELRDRKEKEIHDMGTVLSELRTLIEEELHAEEPAQQELWTSEERDQLERNRSSLHRRLQEIPGEMEKEIAAIERRFADPAAHLFPVAVLFLVPHSLAVRRYL